MFSIAVDYYPNFMVKSLTFVIWRWCAFFFFLVPPDKPKIYEERGQEVRMKLGPYKIGDTILLKCVATGGKKIFDINLKVFD